MPDNFTFEACSARVGAVLGPDVMKSTKVGAAPASGCATLACMTRRRVVLGSAWCLGGSTGLEALMAEPY